MALSDELERLQGLHRAGTLTDEEFAKAKATLLGGSGSPAPGPAAGGGGGAPPPATFSLGSPTERQWAMFIHFGLLAGIVVPLAGFVVPILLWQMKKTEMPGLDVHGKIAVNWMLTELLYGIVAGLLCIVLIGIPLLIALLVLGVVFPILGGLKANEGVAWTYPLSIRFLK